jgi:hypothetical protein
MRAKLRGYDDTYLDWTVYNVGPSGLCIHRTPNRGGQALDCWTVSHLASGYRIVTGLPSACAALRVAKRLARLANWNVPESELSRKKLGQRRHAQIVRLIRTLERGKVLGEKMR